MANTQSAASPNSREELPDRVQQLVHEKQQEDQRSRQTQEEITRLESKSDQER